MRNLFLSLIPLILTFPAVAETITSLPSDRLKWDTTPEGVAFSALSGNRFEDRYLAMVTLPAGIISPAHIKSADMFGVVVSGEMTHVPAGDDPSTGTRLGAGAFYHIPGGMPHVSSCVSTNEDCVTVLYQPGAFDFLPVAQ